MNPRVRRILFPPDHGHRLVICPFILLVRIVIPHRRPDEDPPPPWLHHQPVRQIQLRKACRPPLLHLVEVYEERQYSRSVGLFLVFIYVIVVRTVVRSGRVLQQLQALVILLGYARDGDHTFAQFDHHRIVVAALVAPRVGGGTRIDDLVAGLRSLVARIGAPILEVRYFSIRNEVIQSDYPGTDVDAARIRNVLLARHVVIAALPSRPGQDFGPPSRIDCHPYHPLEERIHTTFLQRILPVRI
mmetsp:Transcript_15735/g.37822  ORF Transcript_15735/g.37822 Transcript_15735/m.37822 type:complete len:244 (-) Transcript_15735:522-1253(-)